MSSVPKPLCLFLVVLSATHSFSSAYTQRRNAWNTHHQHLLVMVSPSSHPSVGSQANKPGQHSKAFILVLQIHLLRVLQHPSFNLFFPSISQVLHPSLLPQHSDVCLSKGIMSCMATAETTKSWTSMAWLETGREGCSLWHTQGTCSKMSQNVRRIQKCIPEEFLFSQDLK